ncbi:MAG: hypothetical protein E7062_03895 [Spirochaetaceae bacterium]|nr:hypothetical protein [Spirochaetaceae bacterium]
MAWGLAEFDAERRGYKVGVQDGISQGAEQKALETARNMLSDGILAEIISKYTGLPLETVEKLAKGLNQK